MEPQNEVGDLKGVSMKAKDIPCKKCGGQGVLRGSDYTDEYGPWHIACKNCGEETPIWAYVREAWAAWGEKNK